MKVLFDRLKPKVQVMLSIIFSILSTVVAGMVVWYGVQITDKYFQLGMHSHSIMKIPQGPVLLIIPLGSFLYLLQSLVKTYTDIVKWKDMVHG